MPDNDVVIEVSGLYKDFVLPHEKAGSVKNIFTNVFSVKNKTYETQHALKNINFKIKKGEFFGIVGRNGSGKSTLLKILAGIYQPTKGVVKTTGRIVPFIELGVGFNGELTGRENVYLNGALLGFSEQEIDDKYKEIVDFAEIERFMDQKLKNYSSGMQVRLAFSVATILAESDILLIDEVLAVGDADFQRKCFDYFRKLKKLKKTVVFVSHDMNAVREYCDRAVLINDSELLVIGSSERVSQEYFQLFENKPKSPKQENESRWGNSKVKFSNPTVSPNKISDKVKEFRIQVELIASEDVEDVVLGISLKNQAGQQLFGTNTHLLGQIPLNFKKGEKLKFSWGLPNVLNTGTYLVDIAAVKWQSPEVFDWWDTACEIKIVVDKNTLYLTRQEIKFEMDKSL